MQCAEKMGSSVSGSEDKMVAGRPDPFDVGSKCSVADCLSGFGFSRGERREQCVGQCGSPAAKSVMLRDGDPARRTNAIREGDDLDARR
eukprot:6211522-Pleurochrysis_carterae.AAC.1